MPKHELLLEMPPKAIFHKDAKVIVYSDGKKLGELRISKGSIEWKPANKQNGIHLSWERFDALMQEMG